MPLPEHPPRQSPSPTPSPSPPAGDAASSASSAKGSRSARSNSGAAVHVGDPGPTFDPGAGGPEPPITQPAALELPGWEQDTVESILTAKGLVLHQVAGVADEDWIYTRDELRAIAPPLTRILNRYDVTRAAAGTGDEMAVIIGLGGYVTRSWIERRAALAMREPAEPEPVTGVAAPAGTDGTSDPAQQAARGEVPSWST